MKPGRYILGLLLAAVSATSSVIGHPVDLSAPTGELGAANAKGYLEIWREIDDVGIDFGKGSFLPLRYRFSSDDTTGGILGPGFYLPMLEARSALIREQVMRAYLPCGKGLYLWQDSVDATKFMTPDKEWTGAVNGDDFTVWRDDGWTIVYHLGQLSSIRTDEGHTFSWDYDPGTHMATGISKDGQPFVSVERNEQGLLGAVVINGQRYEMSYAQRPLTQILLGQPAIKELALALSSFKYPDGKSDTFKFVLSQQLVPSLAFTDLDQKLTTYTWDVATNHIATEQGPAGDWTYKIGEATQPFGSPPISRTNAQGQSEGMTVDNQMGTYTQVGLDGVTTVTHVFETPGPLYHKVQKIEKIKGDVTTLVYRASYDEAGRLIRTARKQFITSYEYDPSGHLIKTATSLSRDPTVTANLAAEEAKLQLALRRSTTIDGRERAIHDLILFYVGQRGNYDKAISLLSAVSSPSEKYNLRLIIILANKSTSLANKIMSLRQLSNDFPKNVAYINHLITAYQK